MKFCEEDSLSEVSGSGATLEMLSGHIYKVDGIDQFEASLWRTPEAVLICSPTFTIEGKTVHSYKITNPGEDGEEVHATQLK
jgi:hypothetical protein